MTEVLDFERIEFVDVGPVTGQLVEGESLVDVETPPDGDTDVRGIHDGETQLEGARRHEAAERVTEERHHPQLSRVTALLRLDVRVTAGAEEAEERSVFTCNTSNGRRCFVVYTGCYN